MTEASSTARQDTHAALAQRSRRTLHFAHPDMDYYLAWIAGRSVYDGSDPDECLAAARDITDGDAQSWRTTWRALAERVEARVRAAAAAGDPAEARRAYLRACTYYRAPLFLMHPADPAFREHWQKMQACFQAAAALFDPPVERVLVPFGEHSLPGYFWKVDGSTEARATLLVFGGIETFAEDCYFMVGPAAPRRGYNVLAVDLPGQGMNPDQGLVFGARVEAAAGAVVDYALGRADVDARRLAAFGFSWGGHIVLRAARYDTRIRALVANPAMPNVFRAVLGQQKGHARHDPVARVAFDQVVWRMGLRISFDPRDIARRFAKAYDYLVHGRVDPRKVPCPALFLAGAGEAPITLRIARECHSQLPHPAKKLVIFTEEQGGQAHCQVDNLALPNAVILDWLDDVLA
jgi:pimeloyl-ACP methyl ester carboxylesterase